MKTRNILLPILLLLFACKKDVVQQAPTPDVEEPGIPLTEIYGADASLQATYYSSIHDSNLIGKVTVFKGYGKAVFRNKARDIILPRRVAVEGTVLTSEQGYYTNDPGKSSGIDFGSSVKWEINGESSPLPSFSNEIANKVPEIGDVNLKDSIYLEEELLLEIDQENPFTNLGQRVDSVKFSIYGPEAVVEQTIPGSDAVLFSASQINSLGKGNGYLQVQVFAAEIKEYGEYRVAFINKGVLNKQVTLHY